MSVKSAKKPAAADASADFPARAPKPKLIFPLGRGGHGKSLWAHWAIDRAHSKGRPVVIADADRTNPTLKRFFDNVETPPGADELTMQNWFMAFCEQQIEQQFNAVIDLGGSDQLLKGIARKRGLSPFFTRFGIEPVAVHLIGPDRNDLAYLRDLEANGLFAPAATILVLNEALTPNNLDPAEAFPPVLDHPVLKAAEERGAVAVWMPQLDRATEVDHRGVSLSAAESGHSGQGLPALGPWSREIIAKWLRDMEQNFAPVAAWLP